MADFLEIGAALAVLFLGVLVVGFLMLVLYLIYVHHKYDHIPGPPRTSFFMGNLSNIRSAVSLAEFLDDQMRLYGSVYKMFVFTKPVVVVLEPNFLKEVLHSTTHSKPPVEHANFWHVFGSRCFDHGLLTETDVPKYLKRRALFTPAFHRKYLMQSMDAFNDSVDLLIERLSRDADGKTGVQMLDIFNKITLDVIAKVAFGLVLDDVMEKDSPFTRAIVDTLLGIQSQFFEPWKRVAFGLVLDDVMEKDSPFTRAIVDTLLGIQSQFFEPWKRYSPLPSDRKFRQNVRQAIHYVRETGRRCIEGRLEAKRRGETLPKDLLTYILEASRDFQADDDFHIEEMIDEFFTFFFAGQETTANMMAFVLVELGHNPEIYERVVTEVNAVFGDKDRVEYPDLVKLEYLTMVIKETLRLWPPAFGTNRLLASDMTVKGMKIPEGTVVWFNTYVMGRMEEYWKDPMVFDPERFSKADKEEREKNLFTYFPFSMGTRACVGQSFAMIEARLIIGRLLHNFKFTLAPGQKRDDIVQEITLKPRMRSTNYLTRIR